MTPTLRLLEGMAQRTFHTEARISKTLYMDHPKLLRCSAIVAELGSSSIKGRTFYWVKLDRTIFHPQGGGQLSDKGTMDTTSVDYVHKEVIGNFNDIEVLHCFNNPVHFSPGQTVHLEVDAQNRHLNSRWHTAAHVLDFLVVKNFPHLKGDSGQCYPENAFMKFVSTNGNYPKKDELQQVIERGFSALLAESVKLTMIYEEGIRKLMIADHAIPCGGTHVSSLSELGALRVKNATLEKKEAKLRISYDLENPIQQN